MVEPRLQGILQSALALCRRMAGAGGSGAARSGCRRTPGIRRQRATRHARGAFGGRARLALALASLAFLTAQGVAHAQVVSSRIWPARDYTRLTLESSAEVKFTLFGVKDPERLVLDLEVQEFSPALA